MTRALALLDKELAELGRNLGVFVPAALTGAVSIALPFFVALVVPTITGERLAESSDFAIALEVWRAQPGARRLEAEAVVQAWIFQQFLILLVLAPVAGSMSGAAFSVIGEKQARTLEPLLATPITTLELLAAKVLGSWLPALALMAVCFAIYLSGIALFALPGVSLELLAPRPLAVVFLLGPLSALAALQLAVIVSSRVNDARSAQQIGALVILPIAGLLVAQIVGSLVLTMGVILLIAAGLTIINILLMLAAIALFDRESILTRWR